MNKTENDDLLVLKLSFCVDDFEETEIQETSNNKTTLRVYGKPRIYGCAINELNEIIDELNIANFTNTILKYINKIIEEKNIHCERKMIIMIEYLIPEDNDWIAAEGSGTSLDWSILYRVGIRRFPALSSKGLVYKKQLETNWGLNGLDKYKEFLSGLYLMLALSTPDRTY